ncbi:MAG: hypothetical protein ABIH64_06365 [Nanoarchaeota archaeon]
MSGGKNILDEFALKFSKIIEKYTEYIIVSGFVAISSGRTRATEDIDMIIRPVSKETFNMIHEDLAKNNFECIQSKYPGNIYGTYLSNFDSARYIHKDKLLPEMELKFAKDELDEYQLKTKTKLELTGLDLWFSNVNVNIAFKEHLLKSQKDIEDAKHLRIVYQELVSEDEIKKVKRLIDKCRI